MDIVGELERTAGVGEGVHEVSTWRHSPRVELLSTHCIPKVRAPRKEAEVLLESFWI